MSLFVVPKRRQTHRASFTLVELMVVLAIISILAGAVLSAMYTVMEEAKLARTQAQVAKLHELVMSQLNGYGTRAIRLDIPYGDRQNVAQVARARLLAIRELMRMELPDRITDLNLDTTTISVGAATVRQATPPRWRSHRRRAGYTVGSAIKPTNWTYAHQGAECLYLIVAGIRSGDASGLDFFQETELGDVDGDGMREILDAWGNPIAFLRWAPGYLSEMQPNDPSVAPDPFDPLNLDTRATFRLVPLVYSAGPDGAYGIASDYDTNPGTAASGIDDPNYDHYVSAGSVPPNDPYHTAPALGTGFGAATETSVDNVTNHLLDE